jgi:hypothetical protein
MLLVLAPLAAAQAGRSLLSGVIVSAVGDGANVSLTFTCPAHYLSHTPTARGRDLVVRLDTTDLCGGLDAAVLGAETRRVRAGELANLMEVEYDGERASGPELTLHFSREMQFRVQSQTNLRELVVSVSTPGPDRVAPVAQATGRFVINLRSSNQPSTAADLETLKAYAGYTAYQTQSVVQGRTWYRLRIGFFDTEKDARAAGLPLRTDYPGLWIGFVEDSEVQAALANPLLASDDTAGASAASAPTATPTESASRGLAPAAGAEAGSPEKRAALLEEGKRALTGGELSQAVQIFTKVLQKTDDEPAEVAQELLGVARERNGQTAHAKAAYEQYLERYPEGEGATRVRQRLTALTASTSGRSSITATSPGAHAENSSAWDFDTSLWQYYQHQVAQANDDRSLLSESALLSNVDLNMRRSGERMDLRTRLSLGYWYDFMGEDGPGNEERFSTAYVEADGHAGHWRARMGRQSRGAAGVLGRFDGMLFSYAPRDRITLNVAGGYPVYSTRDGFDRTRVFESFSVDIADVATSWDLSGFYNQQTADGILDRQAIGAEARYFDDHRSLYALVDYDVSYSTLNNVYLVGNWRTAGQLTMNATVNRAHSPYLTTSNALIGQPLTSIDELLALETEDQIRQFALDRTATSTTYSMGLSRPFLQKLQVDVDVTSTAYSETVASGGVEGFTASDYKYYSITLLGQSLIKEGDMGSVSLHFGDTTSYEVTSLSLDGRYPVGALRLNPRLRIDRRARLADGTSEWIYTPMLRMQLQWTRRYYFEFEGGMYLSNQELEDTTDQFRTTFFNLGYRYVF